MDSLVLEAKHIMDLYSDIADSKPAQKSDSKTKLGFHFNLAHWLALTHLLRAPLSPPQFWKPSKSKPAGEKDDKKKIQMPLFANQKDTGRKKRGRVIGGTDVAEADDYPSYVSIRHDGYHVCGGTIFRIIKRFMTHKRWLISQSHNLLLITFQVKSL